MHYMQHVFFLNFFIFANSTFNTGSKCSCGKQKSNMNIFTPKKGANHTIPTFQTNTIPAGVEMPAQPFLIKEAFQNTARQTPEDSQAPPSPSNERTFTKGSWLGLAQ